MAKSTKENPCPCVHARVRDDGGGAGMYGPVYIRACECGVMLVKNNKTCEFLFQNQLEQK